MHQNAEIGFKEFKTQKAIESFLINKGIKKEKIKHCGGSGLIVDIMGEGQSQGENRLIACRADIDALFMTEEN